MALRRTYRTLPLAIGLILLVGAAAPAVVVCMKTPGDVAATTAHYHEHEAEYHEHETEDRVPAAHADGVEVPCNGGPSDEVHVCCLTGGMMPSTSAAILADEAPRGLGLALAGVLPDQTLQEGLQQTGLHRLRARPAAFTPTSLRQALLATFLI